MKLIIVLLLIICCGCGEKKPPEYATKEELRALDWRVGKVEKNNKNLLLISRNIHVAQSNQEQGIKNIKTILDVDDKKPLAENFFVKLKAKLKADNAPPRTIVPSQTQKVVYNTPPGAPQDDPPQNEQYVITGHSYGCVTICHRQTGQTYKWQDSGGGRWHLCVWREQYCHTHRCSHLMWVQVAPPHGFPSHP